MERLDFGDMNDIPVMEPVSDKEIIQAIQSRRIYSHMEILPPTPIFTIGDSEIMSLGDFSVIKGKAKSRKTFLMSMFVATILSKIEMFGIKPHFHANKNRVIWFDTEQNPYHTQKAIIRATKLSFVDYHEKIEVITLRDLAPSHRKDLITKVIIDLNTEDDISLVIIDGIKDLCTDFNNLEQATEIGTWLLTNTTQKNLHIITVIHENKSVMDKTARGHLGAELTNKAQSIITVERHIKDKDMSVVKCDQLRGSKEFSPIGFTINEFGLPVSASIPEEEYIVRKSKNTPTSFEIEVHKLILNKVFKAKDMNFGYRDLWKAIQLEFEILDKNKRPADNIAKDILDYWKRENLIYHNGEMGTKAKYYKNVSNTNGLAV